MSKSSLWRAAIGGVVETTSPIVASACTMRNARTPRSGVSGCNQMRTSSAAPVGAAEELVADAGSAGASGSARHEARRGGSRCQRAKRGDEVGGDNIAFASRDRGLDRLFEYVGGAEQRVHDRRLDRHLAATNAVEHRLELVGQVGDERIAHRRRHPLDRVDGAEDLTDRRRSAGARRIALELQQRLIDGGDVLSALGEKELRVLAVIHGAGVARGRPCSAENALNRFENATGLERLDDEVLRAGLDRFDDERLLPHRAAHEDSRARVELADLAHGVDAAHVGHHDVHRHQIGAELAVLLYGLKSRLRLADDLEPGLSEDVPDHRAHEDGVVTDQYSLTQESLPKT